MSAEDDVLAELRRRLIADEGLRFKPYKDTVGKLTIGVGRNLDDVGLFADEVDLLLRNDMLRVVEDCAKFEFWPRLNTARKVVIASMAFNLGMAGLKGFVNTLADVSCGDYESAAKRMLQSKWATQVGARAIRLADMMRTGVISK